LFECRSCFLNRDENLWNYKNCNFLVDSCGALTFALTALVPIKTFGAATVSVMALNIMTEHCYAECHK
jgi:hypothetical protein